MKGTSTDLKAIVHTHIAESMPRYSADELKAQIYQNGMCSIKRALPREWSRQLREDYEPIMQQAHSRPGGTINRGPNRFYHAIYAEQLTGFVDLVTHPIFISLSEAVLGKHYSIVEVAFDVPLPGAKNQPWHRDFPIPTETQVGRWLSSLAFNLTTVDVTEDMGAFQIAYGTHWDDGADFGNRMFPKNKEYARLEKMGTLCYPQLGDMSCRTGLTVHRGTEHNASVPRPVLIVGVVADTILPYNPHKILMTRQYFDTLPDSLKPHLNVQLTDEIEPINQKHDIEGLRYESS